MISQLHYRVWLSPCLISWATECGDCATLTSFLWTSLGTPAVDSEVGGKGEGTAVSSEYKEVGSKKGIIARQMQRCRERLETGR